MKGLIPIIWIVLLLMVVPSLAITIHIPADYTTIQAGINAANNDDEVLVADGTYSEHIDFLGKAIVVISENGAEATFIEKVYDDQTIVSFATGEDENSVLDGFTVRNSYDQAAIICDGTSPVIKNCIIEDNYNIIYSPSSTGGGLLFRNNAAPRITKNIFRDNYAMHGAAIAGYGCDEYHQALIDSNYIHNNETHNNGAGFHFYDCSFIFKHNLVFNNIAGVAGGAGRIDARGGIIENNAICNNAASSLAGGIFTDGNSTDTYIRNNIFYGNDFYGFYVASGSNFHLLYNCFYANVSGPYFYINPEEGNILVDPLMIDPENDDYNLTGSSPCINAGDPSSPQDPDGSRADIGALYYHEETPEELLEWIGSITTPGNTYGVDVVGQYAYTADYYEGMSVIDISDPVNPVIVGRESMPGRALDIRVNGNYAYCSDDGEGSLSIVDISDPANPTLTSTLYTTDRAYSLDVIGDYVFVADGGAGVQVVDVSDPYNPIIIDNIAFPTGGVFVEGNLGYIVNNSTGLIIIDITDPSNCITLGTTALSGDPHKGVRVRDGYAYVAVYHAGLEVIDV
ncbi:MAG: hypothetical protein GY839_15410, partial [candidate division Zixibacteria bacterium]|nr:hypothetical protein [candidate division Zixibacteria bacterium]